MIITHDVWNFLRDSTCNVWNNEPAFKSIHFLHLCSILQIDKGMGKGRGHCLLREQEQKRQDENQEEAPIVSSGKVIVLVGWSSCQS